MTLFRALAAAAILLGALAAAGPNAQAASSSVFSAVWANDGEDKVTRDELRASNGANVLNSVWDGTKIVLFGARNEVVDFNLILESAASAVTGVTVEMSDLTGPNGYALKHSQRNASGLFRWNGADIELFFVRYLKILGVSRSPFGTLATWQEPTFPPRVRCPENPGPGCPWASRPVANKFYPDIAVPMEAVRVFGVAAGSNQSVWADVYIPNAAPPGAYAGTLTVKVGGAPAAFVPVTLQVRDFVLPEVPAAKTMVYASDYDLYKRYGQDLQQTAWQNQMLLAHRHKISLIDDNLNGTWASGAPTAVWLPYLDGSAFTAAKGYVGPGANAGNGVFSIGTYGAMTQNSSQSDFTANFNAWESWFEANSPNTERFAYLCDETACQSQTPTLDTQLSWWSAISGPGASLHTLATQPLLMAPATLSDPTSSWPFSQGQLTNTSQGMRWTGGYPSADQAAANKVRSGEPARRLFAYNGGRPGSGTFATEDEGTAVREIPWGQIKRGIDRWFFWNANYYDNFQGGLGETDVFNKAQTFGGAVKMDASYGLIGWNSNNGDGVLFYPGTDLLFPKSSYNLAGPIASLRLKHWRRGIQDMDYLALARRANLAAANAVLAQMVPKALWENSCYAPVDDCTYTYSPVSWSEKPDDWEAARAQLAHIIDGQ